MATGDFGIIWKLDPSKTLDMNITDGIAAHKKRTGVPAEVVDVNPEDFKHHFVDVPGVEVRADVGTLKGEVFVGRKAKTVSHAEAQISQRSAFLGKAE